MIKCDITYGKKSEIIISGDENVVARESKLLIKQLKEAFGQHGKDSELAFIITIMAVLFDEDPIELAKELKESKSKKGSEDEDKHK